MLAEFCLTSKASSHVLADNPHRTYWQPERCRQRLLLFVNCLGRHPHRELLSLPARHRHVGFHGCMYFTTGFISLFNEYICFAESFGEVASLICIWPSYQVPCVVQERLPRLQCILCVQQVGQFLILDLHETKRIVGLIRSVCCQCCNFLSLITAMLIKEEHGRTFGYPPGIGNN